MNAYNSITPETIQEDMRYLQLLSHSFPTIADASTEIINLEAILNLPKGTEPFPCRPARRVRGIPACIAECFRGHQKKSK